MELFTPSKKEVWTCNYKGHEIRVENTAKATLFIDGKEAAQEKGIISVMAALEAKLPDSEETVMAFVGGATKVDCHIIIGQKPETSHFMENIKTGEVTPINE